MAKIQGVLAEAEVAKTSKRVRRAHADIAKKGGWSGGRRPFGYLPGMTGEDPREAAAIRDGVTRILDGESIASVTRRWNADGILTTGGKPHTSNNVAKMLRRRYLVGVREHNGTETPAAWPAILDETTHAALLRVLAANSASNGGGYRGGRTYALSGILRCGPCGGRMYGRPTTLKSGPAYYCRAGTHTQAPVADVDGTVRAAVVARLSRVNTAGELVPEVDRAAADARQVERVALEARRAGLPRAVALGHMEPEQVAEASRIIDERLAELDAADHADADAVSRPERVLAGLTGHPREVTAALFDALPVDRQRAVITVLGTPFLARAGRGGRPVFNPERVTFEWSNEAA